ncbi:MAG: WG repeat-containing protein [Bacteroidetes bacterium]|nr:WG repeat-containing protein [Bacteroidota bacterium]
MKKIGLFWKIILLLLTTTSCIILFLLGARIYERKYGSYRTNAYISENCREIEYYNGNVKLLNVFTGKVTTPRMDWISEPGIWDTTTVFSMKGRRGYLNKFSGEITIPAQYSRAWKFSEGLGAVVINSRLGFINGKGQTVIPFKFYYFNDEDKRADFVFRNGYCSAIDSNGKFGLINKNGAWVIPPRYDYINTPNHGYRTIKLGDQYGMLDSTLNWNFLINYDFIAIREDGFSLSKEGSQQLIAWDKKTVIQAFSYDQTNLLEYDSGNVDEDGNAIYVKSDFIAYRVHTHWGILDKNGKVLVKAIYDQVLALSNTLFSCQIGDNWITVNSKGSIIH